jgi:hypothetical protein
MPPLNDGCFGKGTRIATATGSLAIEDVQVGDLVQAVDVKTGLIVERPVTQVFVHEGHRVGLLPTATGPLRVTANHPIYDASTSTFVEAGQLREPFSALELVSNDSASPSLLSGFVPLEQIETVYNLSVADVHTYFAGGVLVHNKPRCGYPGDPPDCPCIPGEPNCPGFGPVVSTGGAGGATGMSGAGSGGEPMSDGGDAGESSAGGAAGESPGAGGASGESIGGAGGGESGAEGA